MRRLRSVLGLGSVFGASWLAPYRVRAPNLGPSWGLLGASWGGRGRLGTSLGTSWGRLGASGRRLGLDFLSKRIEIEAFHLECHFLLDS